MLQEYAVVRLKRAVDSVPVQPGTTGAVLIVYDSDPAAYEVEFVDETGESLGTHTVLEANLEQVGEATQK